MKTIFFALLLFTFSFNSYAQDVIRQEPCYNASIQKQADSIKALVAKDGFSVIREASMKMESEFEMPIILPMKERTVYHFVFIGESNSDLYEVRMYDMEENMVVYQKKKWGDVDGNIIAYSYVPKFSEFHMIKPLQVNKKKKKELCGYVMLFQKMR
jgi:hypothetical protein